MKRTTKNEIDHFSKLEHIWWGAKTAAGQKRYDLKAKSLFKFCKPSKKSKILEIGCGDGEFTKRIIRYSDNIIATDVTPEVIKRAKKGNDRKGPKYVVDNCEKMQFKSNSFDIVCGISILHHVDTQKTLNESFRVLKNGGKLFFTEPNIINPNIFIGLKVHYLREKMEYSPDEIAFKRWDLVEMLKKSGYKNIQVRNYDFLHPLTPKKYVKLLMKLSDVLEKIPLAKEISGSLLIYAEK